MSQSADRTRLYRERKATRDRLDAQAARSGYVRVPDALVYLSAGGKVLAFREDGTRLSSLTCKGR